MENRVLDREAFDTHTTAAGGAWDHDDAEDLLSSLSRDAVDATANPLTDNRFVL
jgi:hypothetical protein